MKPSFVIALALAACFLAAPSVHSTAHADDVTTLRFATLAPHGSPWMKVMRAWDKSLSKETDGKVRLRFYSGGSQGDERDFVRKVRAGQMDGAAVTTTGLGIIVRPVLVLSAPGVATTYEQLSRIRTKMGGKFDKMFIEAGFKLIAWGDGGPNRLFSTQPFVKPSDFKSRRPWAWKDDPIFAQYVRGTGANPVLIGVNEVYPGLQTGMVDTVPNSALGAVALQWYTKLKYMSKQRIGMIVGASVLKKEKFDALTPAQQKSLLDTGERAARALDKLGQKADKRSYDTLVKRGLQVVDLGPHQAAWDKLAADTRNKLAGRVYSKALLKEVMAVARGK